MPSDNTDGRMPHTSDPQRIICISSENENIRRARFLSQKLIKYEYHMNKTGAKGQIILGADHAGFPLKEDIKNYLRRLGYEVHDIGTDSMNSCDYPDFVIPAAKFAIKMKCRAIVFGGSGEGECMAANKVKGVRCALVYDAYTARMSREHNNANVMALGGRTATKDVKLAKKLVKIWLETPFSDEERHVRRIGKISRYESTV
jgi:ribose 5-phosphate isomerase B